MVLRRKGKEIAFKAMKTLNYSICVSEKSQIFASQIWKKINKMKCKKSHTLLSFNLEISLSESVSRIYYYEEKARNMSSLLCLYIKMRNVEDLLELCFRINFTNK